MPFFLIFDLKPILTSIEQLLQNECPLLPYYGLHRSVELWFAMSIERIMLIEHRGSNYPTAEEYHCFNLDRLDALLSKLIQYPQLLEFVRTRGYQSFSFMINTGYDGVIYLDY